ncbi:hypothetical protein TNCV_3191191 [Trichonephila clavipes]|nr:hypothetical protein TNCV_3191191 [Trichonephila clavipes]
MNEHLSEDNAEDHCIQTVPVRPNILRYSTGWKHVPKTGVVWSMEFGNVCGRKDMRDEERMFSVGGTGSPSLQSRPRTK